MEKYETINESIERVDDSEIEAVKSIVLLGCPFCGQCNPHHGQDTGGDDPKYFNYWIECHNEECSAELSAPTENECALRWNKRTPNEMA